MKKTKLLTLKNAYIGMEFLCNERRWRCTDIGSRVIVAICIEPSEREITTVRDGVMNTSRSFMTSDWFNGPPYAVSELVFDEYDIAGCYEIN